MNTPSEDVTSMGDDPQLATGSECCFKSPKHGAEENIVITEELATFPMLKFLTDGM